MKRLLIFIYLFLFAIYFCNKAGCLMLLQLSISSRILIGDQINFTITVDQPSDLKLSLPFFKDTLCRNIEILSGPVIDTSCHCRK